MQTFFCACMTAFVHKHIAMQTSITAKAGVQMCAARLYYNACAGDARIHISHARHRASKRADVHVRRVAALQCVCGFFL